MKRITSEKGNDLLKEKDTSNGIWVRRELRTAYRGAKRKKEKERKDVLGYQRQKKKGSGTESPRGHGDGSAEPAD